VRTIQKLIATCSDGIAEMPATSTASPLASESHIASDSPIAIHASRARSMSPSAANLLPPNSRSRKIGPADENSTAARTPSTSQAMLYAISARDLAADGAARISTNSTIDCTGSHNP
jgi:hypothetical protein